MRPGWDVLVAMVEASESLEFSGLQSCPSTRRVRTHSVEELTPGSATAMQCKQKRRGRKLALTRARITKTLVKVPTKTSRVTLFQNQRKDSRQPSFSWSFPVPTAIPGMCDADKDLTADAEQTAADLQGLWEETQFVRDNNPEVHNIRTSSPTLPPGDPGCISKDGVSTAPLSGLFLLFNPDDTIPPLTLGNDA